MPPRTDARKFQAPPPSNPDEKELVGDVVFVPIRTGKHWIVARLKDGSSVTGTDVEKEVIENQRYRFVGKWKKHDQYGWQFAFDTYTVDTPVDRAGVIQYLLRTATKTGIGEVTASKLWGVFGPNTIDVLVKSPMKAVEAGVMTADSARLAHEKLAEDIIGQKTKVQLFGLLSGFGIPAKSIRQCFSILGVNAHNLIRENPFIMLERDIDNIGFNRADRLYQEFGLDLNSPIRQMYCLWNLVEEAAISSGHTWMQVSTLHKELHDKIPTCNINKAIEEAIAKNRLVVASDSRGSKWLADRKRCRNEMRISYHLNRLRTDRRPLRWPRVGNLKSLSEHQAKNIGISLSGRVGILAGSPGTGKTYTSASVIEWLVKTYGVHDVAICAPTGKAAVRLTEVMRSRGLEDVTAYTIHRLLGVGFTVEGMGFGYNRENPMPHSFIIVDEVSMVGTDLMSSFLEACNDDAHILFVGDPGQLPPVEHGAPMRDMIESGIPTGELREIHRNSGQIIKACKQIKDGERFETCDTVDLEAGKNLRFVAANSSDKVISSLTTLYDKFEEKKVIYGYDLFNDIQVITPVNDKGAISRKALNKILQEKINPAGHRVDGNPYRVGDKVICLRNNFSDTLECMDDRFGLNADSYATRKGEGGNSIEEFIANGEIGRIVAVGKSRCIAQFFPNPSRKILVAISVRNALEKRKKSELETEEDSPYDLAYAITIHKSQGAEWKCVIFVTDPQPTIRFASRELVYTGISRARELCFILGTRRTIDTWCEREVTKYRNTFLRDYLAGSPPAVYSGAVHVVP